MIFEFQGGYFVAWRNMTGEVVVYMFNYRDGRLKGQGFHT